MSLPQNNLELFKMLKQLPAEQQLVEYANIAPRCSFKVKSFGYLMQKGAEFEKLAGDAA